MTSYPTSGGGGGGGGGGSSEGSTTFVNSAVPLHGFAAPPKGYFTPRSTDVPPATSPSLVPTKGRRRESVGGQLRRNVSASTAAAAGAGGGLGHSFLLSSRQATSSTVNGDLSTSLGAAAAEVLSMSSASSSSTTTSLSRSQGLGGFAKQPHTHFGQECYGPQPGETPLAPPTSMLSSSAVTRTSSTSTTNARRPSVATMEDETSSEVTTFNASGVKLSHTQMLHKCEACAKVYRHPSCLIKHRWEHTVYWKEASKFLMSKHQQVQLLEAAAILVGMDCNPRSLPEEKALWPAAVSPPSSGLLGSDKVNFDKLMAQKHAHRKSDSSSFSERSATKSPSVGPTPNTRYAPLPPTPNGGHSMPRGSSIGLLSPLNALTTLNLAGSPVTQTAQTPTSRMRGANGDVQHLQLDESAERTSGLADDDEDEDGDDNDDTDEIDTDSPAHQSDDRERDDLGAGVEMQMEGVE